MKKILLLLIVLFVSTYSFCQTTAKSYKAPVKSYKAPVKSYQTPAKTSQSSTIKSQNPVITSPASAVTAPIPVVAAQSPAVTSPTPVAASPVPAVVAQNPVVQSQAPVNSYRAPVNSHQTSAASSQAQPVSYRTIYDADQTTQEEYDYVTKELKIQIDGNFDMRKGYELRTIKVVNNDQKRIELGQLIRTEDKSVACYWLKFTNFKTFYFCLPNPHSTTSIINKCNTDLTLGMNANSLSMSIISLLSGLQWQVN